MFLALAAAIAALLLMTSSSKAAGGGTTPLNNRTTPLDAGTSGELMRLAKENPSAYAVVVRLLQTPPTNPAMLGAYGMMMLAQNAKGQPNFPLLGAALVDLANKVDPELLKQLADYATINQEAYNDAMKLLVAPSPDPYMLAVFAARTMNGWPLVSVLLGQRFDETVTKATGKSGTVWNTWSSGKLADGSFVVLVFEGAAHVLTYSQQGSDKKTRRALGNRPEEPIFKTTPGAVARARADFGV